MLWDFLIDHKYSKVMYSKEVLSMPEGVANILTPNCWSLTIGNPQGKLLTQSHKKSILEERQNFLLISYKICQKDSLLVSMTTKECGRKGIFSKNVLAF